MTISSMLAAPLPHHGLDVNEVDLTAKYVSSLGITAKLDDPRPLLQGHG